VAESLSEEVRDMAESFSEEVRDVAESLSAPSEPQGPGHGETGWSLETCMALGARGGVPAAESSLP
jgi:hypothetical protein